MSVKTIRAYLSRFLLLSLVPLCILGLPFARAQVPGISDGLPEPATMKNFYRFPPVVEAVRNQSIVGVKVIIPRFDFEKGKLLPQVFMNAGIVYNDEGSVLTTAHTLGESPAEWYDKNTSIFVYDGARAFEARLIQIDPDADLAELRVKNLKQHEPSFVKKGAIFAGLEDKKSFARIEHFYTFGLVEIDGVPLFWPHLLGPYLMETNVSPKGEILPVSFGVVNVPIQEGFSGGILIGADGKVYGILSRASSIYTYVVKIETIELFIGANQ